MTAVDLLRLVASRGGKLRIDKCGRIEVSGPAALVFDPALLVELARLRGDLTRHLKAAGRALP